MALAAHPGKFYAVASSTTATGTDEIGGVNSVDFGPSVDLIDITDFKDTSGAHIKLSALTDGSMTIAGDLDTTNAPQQLLRTSMATGASVWITAWFNPSGSVGVKGFKVECKVASYKVSAKVDGKNEFSSELQFTGAVTAE